jgi:hypothetical protein
MSNSFSNFFNFFLKFFLAVIFGPNLFARNSLRIAFRRIAACTLQAVRYFVICRKLASFFSFGRSFFANRLVEISDIQISAVGTQTRFRYGWTF